MLQSTAEEAAQDLYRALESIEDRMGRFIDFDKHQTHTN